MEKLLSTVSNDSECTEGTVKNCRWIYYPTNTDYCGVLAFASKSGFDRWANSRIIELHTVIWDVSDPDFEQTVKKIIEIFD